MFRAPLDGRAAPRRHHVRRALRGARREHHARPHAQPRHAARDRDGDDSRAVRRDRARRHAEPQPHLRLPAEQRGRRRRRARARSCARSRGARTGAPSTDADVADLMPFYEMGRAEGSFDTGIQFALERLLVSPQFLYRIEREPTRSQAPLLVSDVELASRLSFFLWSSIPDDELLDSRRARLATRARRACARRCGACSPIRAPSRWSRTSLRSGCSCATSRPRTPTSFCSPITTSRCAQRSSARRSSSSTACSAAAAASLELLTAKHTFVNERLAKHYGIPNVQGSYFRRVELGADSRRSGLLGQGSILTVTSYATRTSPVLRGKYVLDNLLASPPPPPPPDVPALATEDDAATARRSRCARRWSGIARTPPARAATRRWTRSASRSSTSTPSAAGATTTPASRSTRRASCWTAASIDGLEGVQALLTARPELFVSALTEKLMMYALGRNVQYYDAPAVRAVVRAAAERNYEFSAIVEGIVASVPFQMRAGHAAARSDHGRRRGSHEVRNGHVSRAKKRCRAARSCAASARRSRCRCSTRWCRRSRPTARRGRRGSASSTSATASCTRPSSCRAPAPRSSSRRC